MIPINHFLASFFLRENDIHKGFILKTVETFYVPENIYEMTFTFEGRGDSKRLLNHFDDYVSLGTIIEWRHQLYRCRIEDVEIEEENETDVIIIADGYAERI